MPVYSDRKDNIVGMLLVKRLIKLDPLMRTPILQLSEASIPPPTCLASTPLYDLLNQFQTGKSKSACCSTCSVLTFFPPPPLYLYGTFYEKMTLVDFFSSFQIY